MHRGPGRSRVNQEMADNTQAMRELAGAAVQMMAHIQQNQNNNNNNHNNHQPEGNVGFHGLTEFKRMDPPCFKGGFNPEGAEWWIQELEKIFEALQCTNTQRAICVVFMLKEEAKIWRKNDRRFLEVGGI